MNKKVLIITYYWPPAGGPGVQRWLKFVKYLPEFGVEPIVYCPENPSYPLLDDDLVKEVSDKVTILKQPIFEPYQLASIFSKKKTKTIASGLINTKKQTLVEKLLLYIRGNYFIPDARKFWVKPSVNYLSKYIRENGIETIITTGPPHSLHLIGLQLKKQLNINWIADFRDPWTTIGYHDKMKLSVASQQKHKLFEKEVLETADNILVTSPSTKTEFEVITQKPITVITNGFDDVKVKRFPLDTKFTLSHIGSLLSGRNPKVLWDSIAELLQENIDFNTHFELKLIGAVSNDVLASIKECGLVNHVNVMGYISHKEAQIQQRVSQVLLLIEIDSPITKCIIPGKLFEYLQSNRPILGFGPEKADFKAIIAHTNTGSSFGYEQTEKKAIKAKLRSCFEAYQKENLDVNGTGIQQYHRKNLTSKLAEILP
ncbi:MAG: glycosyl transferase family 1 [Flavobacteriaceae bacterium]|nr:glycosyl transferase family 1 [Flavobacteriaceae bacterium]